MDARRRAERRLAAALIESRAEDAAAALEEVEPAEAAEVLGDSPPDEAARVLGWMAPAQAAATLERMGLEVARDRLAALAPRAGAAISRRLAPGTREPLLASLPRDAARAIQSLLHYPDGTAGALMDPEMLALPVDLEVRVARTRVMERPSEAHYNLYVIERGGELVGVLNLRELFASPEHRTLGTVMNDATYRIDARAERLEVLAHPGWKHVHSLPVVDEGGRFLGAIRFRTLRGLEEEAFRRASGSATSTGRALGELYWTGVSGMLDALVSALAPAAGETTRNDTDHGRRP